MVYLELIFVLLLILLNGLFAMAELAVVSSRRSRLQSMIDQGVVGSRRALALASDPGKFLSAVQIGITLVGVLSGAFSGATLGLRLSAWLETLGIPNVFAEWIGVGLVVAVLTYASLVVGELVPKQIALRNPERVATKVAPFMTFVARIASPLIFVLDVSGRLVLRALGQASRDDQKVSEDEIRTLMAEAETAGVIEAAERDMMAIVMRLGDRPVRALMTPRREVDMIDLTTSPETIRRTLEESVHSRLPVHEGQADDVLGIVQSKDMLNAYLRGEVPDVRDHVLIAPTIPDTADVLDAVDTIKRSQVHLALIMDEYGHFQGVVTNSDIMEAIVGTFATEGGQVEDGAVQRSDGSWLISGSMPVDEMAERLGITIPTTRSYYTAAGFVLERFGYLPSVGESVTDYGWRFEIIDLDGRRIDKILAQRITRRSAH